MNKVGSAYLTTLCNINPELAFITFTGFMGIFCFSMLYLFLWNETKKANGKYFGDFERTRENIEGMDMIFIGLIVSGVCIVSSIQFLLR